MKRLLCYAHFDADREVKPFVKHALRSMSPLCSTMVFVSNSPFPEEERSELSALCRHVQVRENVGYDFSMWKSAIAQVDHREYDEVVLMNSSIYGPISPLEPLFEEMGARDCDFWGITESVDLQPHVQSYFLVFKKQVVSSPRFAAFWDAVLPYRDKRQVILNYEAGLSTWLHEAGFKMAAYRDFAAASPYIRRSGKRVKRRHDLSVRYAVQLLESGNPFLKVAPVKKGDISKAKVAGLLASHRYPLEYLAEPKPSTSACPLCGQPGTTAHRVKNFLQLQDAEAYEYRRCQNKGCGSVWLVSPPPCSAIPSLNYPEYVPNPHPGNAPFLARSLFKLMSLGGLLKKRRSFFLRGLDRVPPGSVLEIGCGRGERLGALQALGWQVAGVETAGDAGGLAELRSAGIEAVPGGEAGGNLPAGQYDALLLSGFPSAGDPKLLLADGLRLLKPGGKIYLSAPNVDALGHVAFGKFWIGIAAPRHAVLYSQKAIKGLLCSAGFQDVKVRTVSCNAEIYAMHSLDIAYDNWTSLATESRVGRETLPVFCQLLSSLLGSVLKGRGEECFAVATKVV